MCSERQDDRTTAARIRDAAIELIAQRGLAAFTARTVAEAAGVSPGSVIHHFGSMDGLREACDRHAAAQIRTIKSEAAAKGVTYDPMESFKQQSEGLPVALYIAAVLVESSPEVDALVDEMVADAAEYTEQMVESGLVKPTVYPEGRAALLVAISLGNLMMRKHLGRLLGVDIAHTPDDPADAAPYMGPMLELFHQGFTTDAAFELMHEAFVDGTGREGTTKESGTS